MTSFQFLFSDFLVCCTLCLACSLQRAIPDQSYYCGVHIAKSPALPSPLARITLGTPVPVPGSLDPCGHNRTFQPHRMHSASGVLTLIVRLQTGQKHDKGYLSQRFYYNVCGDFPSILRAPNLFTWKFSDILIDPAFVYPGSVSVLLSRHQPWSRGTPHSRHWYFIYWYFQQNMERRKESSLLLKPPI